MSAPLFKKDILFLQRILACSGLYKGSLDGKWNKKLGDADEAFDVEYEKIKKNLGEFDSRTERNIVTLIPKAQILARKFMNSLPTGKLTVQIISGTRTYAEQDALYAIGRTVEKNRSPVTNAKGGQSNHNFGIAWDVGIFDGGKYYTGATAKEETAYKNLGDHIKAQINGIEWGGDWKSFVDRPHYQCKTDKSTSQVRALFQAGRSYL